MFAMLLVEMDGGKRVQTVIRRKVSREIPQNSEKPTKKADRAPGDRAKSNPTKMGGSHTKIGGTVIPQTRESPK